jgi:hypothetical protein
VFVIDSRIWHDFATKSVHFSINSMHCFIVQTLGSTVVKHLAHNP